MINGLREAFTSMLAEVTWLDESTRKSAIEKVHGEICFCYYYYLVALAYMCADR